MGKSKNLDDGVLFSRLESGIELLNNLSFISSWNLNHYVHSVIDWTLVINLVNILEVLVDINFVCAFF